MVASSGGHLFELDVLSRAMDVHPDSLWVTFDSPQTRSLLAGRRVLTLPYVAPRDHVGVLRATRALTRVLREERAEAVVSTGAAVAVSGFLAARRSGIPAHYVESVSRTHGPSLTGRIVSGLHLATLWSQHPGWAGGRWHEHPSVMAEYAVVPAEGVPPARPRLFVTVGTIRPYRFDALVDAVLATGLADEHTVWQLGSTTRDDLPGRVVPLLDPAELEDCVRAADVVVTHAGVGSVLGVLEQGVVPVVVPRRAARDEHVDDHQREIAALVADLGVAVVREAGELDAVALRASLGRRVRRTAP
ncbi:hypothetical protein ASG41_07895 [Modestobacter sp. Leaf380]|nr:hypothetical protein ASG41_07895 [Modestobacter sp. Leaf380]